MSNLMKLILVVIWICMSKMISYKDTFHEDTWFMTCNGYSILMKKYLFIFKDVMINIPSKFYISFCISCYETNIGYL